MLYLTNLYPLYLVYCTYNGIKFTENEIRRNDGWKSAVKILKEENKVFKELDVEILEKNLEPVCNIYKIKNLSVIKYPSLDNLIIACAGGASLLPKKAILIWDSILRFDMPAAIFVSKHELGHIVHNHILKGPLISLISSIALSIFLSSRKLTGLKDLL
jgi:Zn-dependent protease with chaperone function